MKFYWPLYLFISSLNLYAACPDVSFSCNRMFPVHLSFDDGPNKNTEKVLNTLRENNVRASFFQLAEKLIDKRGYKKRSSEQYFKLLDRIISEGHTIGSHTYSHIHHYDYKNEENNGKTHNISWEENISIPRESEALSRYLLRTGNIYYRLPYGQGWFEAEKKVNPDTEVLEHLLNPIENNAKAYHVGWDVDSRDWEYQNKIPLNGNDDRKFLQGIAKQICQKDGGIILMHDHTEMVSRNLSCLIKGIKKAGHKFSPIQSFVNRKNSGPKVVMDFDDIIYTSKRNCNDAETKDQLDNSSELLDNLIEKLMKDNEYSPEAVTPDIIIGDIYSYRKSNGSMKYKHIATVSKYKNDIQKYLESEDFKIFVTSRNLNEEEIVLFQNSNENIQIGTKNP